jgi:hypothetical protein
MANAVDSGDWDVINADDTEDIEDAEYEIVDK